jgi:hypothetical protein
MLHVASSGGPEVFQSLLGDDSSCIYRSRAASLAS